MPCSSPPAPSRNGGARARSATALPLCLSLVLAATSACNHSGGARLATADGPRSDATKIGVTPQTVAPVVVEPVVEAPLAVAGPPAASNVPSITAVSGYERILQKPTNDGPLIGLFRAGQSVPLADPEPLAKAPVALGVPLGFCPGGWYSVKPRGYVCLGPNSTTDANDPRAIAAREVLPDITKPLPFHVGVAIGSPQYLRIPTPEEQRSKEKKLDAYLANIPAPDAVGAIDTSNAGHGPSAAFKKYLEVTKPELVADEDAYAGRKIAWAREFDAEGRTWLETPDMRLIPKDKVRVVTGSTLTGIDLKKHPEIELPLAFAWVGDVPKIQKTGDGKMIETGEVYERHSFVPVKPNLVKAPGGFYWETLDGYYVHNDLFTVLKKRTDRPKNVTANDKWIDVKITWGALVAYEGDTPVFVTAISPGQDGVTQHAHSRNTNRGLFQVGWKLYSANMSGVDNGKEWAVDEVPYVGYYHESFALHGAFWHDDFGRPKSHGCVNLSPADAQWMWNWMNPDMPEGWYAVAAYYPDVKSTFVDVGP